ncbi:MAG: hypothetical protein LQ346_007296 [Caloplaca aetnensis]|nr:MAG: hypothetical protein LQ346_007296 [Caloplaca aetnensis]
MAGWQSKLSGRFFVVAASTTCQLLTDITVQLAIAVGNDSYKLGSYSATFHAKWQRGVVVIIDCPQLVVRYKVDETQSLPPNAEGAKTENRSETFHSLEAVSDFPGEQLA